MGSEASCSGGFPSFVTQPGTLTTLEPEKVTSYEIGFKSELADRKLRINGSIFLMDYKDLQVQTPNLNGPGLVITNAAKARIKGAELEVDYRPTHAFRLFANVGYTDAKYRDYQVVLTIPAPGGGSTTIITDYSGNRLPYAPRWSGSFGGSYTIETGANYSLTLGTNWNFRSQIFFDPYQNAAAQDGAYWLGNVNVSYGRVDDRWRATLFVQNLTNTRMKGFEFAQPYVSPAIYAPLRQFGGRVAVNF